LITKFPNLQALRDMNERTLTLGGGLPAIMGKEVVGGIGVGGAPGTQFNERCSLEGLTSIEQNLPYHSILGFRGRLSDRKKYNTA